MCKILLTLTLALCSICTVHAQLSKKQVERLLTNSSSRSWQFNSYKKTLGNACTGGGQLFVFRSDGTMQRKTCVLNKQVFSEFKWKIEAVGDSTKGEWAIILDPAIEFAIGQKVQALRIDLPNGQVLVKNKKMIWRDVPSCKQCVEQLISLSSLN